MTSLKATERIARTLSVPLTIKVDGEMIADAIRKGAIKDVPDNLRGEKSSLISNVRPGHLAKGRNHESGLVARGVSKRPAAF